MSLFIDTLTDDKGREYEYGHCYMDDGKGREIGCGMEYAYYHDAGELHRWHDAVGQVTVTPFNREMLANLENEHAPHMRFGDELPTFEYVVHVDAATREQADQVMAERLDPDEDYGFPYTIGYDYETSEEN